MKDNLAYNCENKFFKQLLKTFLFVITTSMTSFAQVCDNCLPHTDPENKGNWIIQEEFSDEFNDGNIDETKWHKQGQNNTYFNGWKGRSPSQFIPESFIEGNGNLKILTTWDPDFNFANEMENGVPYGSVPLTTGALISKKFITHCYMEIKCKVGDNPMSASFWGVGEGNSGGFGEIDVFEHVGRSWDPDRFKPFIKNRMQSSFHSWLPNRPGGEPNRVWTNNHRLDFDITKEHHIYAADWTPEYIRLYADGRLIREITKSEAESIIWGQTNAWVMTTPIRLWLDSEIFSWEGSLDKLTKDMFDNANFEIDYVRVWKRGNGGTSENDGHGVNLVKNGDFKQNINNWDVTGISSRPNVSGWTFWKDNNPSDDDFCLQIGQGQTKAKQVITGLKPNTYYLFKASVRMPGTTGTYEPKNDRPNPVSWNDGWIGVENYGGSAKEIKLFYNWFQSYAIEFKTGNTNREATIYFNNKAVGSPMHIDEVSVVELKDLTSTTLSTNTVNKVKTNIIYPNPSNRELSINITEKIENSANFEIFDVNGKSVYKAPITDNVTVVNLNLNSGIYLVTIKNGTFNAAEKLVIE